MILLMLDGSVDLSEQDEVIGGLCYEANLPTIIVVNKWDLVKKDDKTMELFKNRFDLNSNTYHDRQSSLLVLKLI